MSARAGIEGERGVDRAQIHELLALTPTGRVDRQVATAEVRIELGARSGKEQSRR